MRVIRADGTEELATSPAPELSDEQRFENAVRLGLDETTKAADAEENARRGTMLPLEISGTYVGVFYPSRHGISHLYGVTAGEPGDACAAEARRLAFQATGHGGSTDPFIEVVS
jgi:hypothetical protein